MNCVATLLMALIIFRGEVSFWDFIWFGFFNGSVLALSMPSRQAFVPELIPEKLIFTAMALNTTGWNLSRIIGPACAGLLIAFLADGDKTSTYGVGIVYLVIAFLYFLSAVVTLSIDAPGNPQRTDNSDPISDIREGLLYVLERPNVFALIVLSIIPFLFGMPLNTFLPAFNEDILGGHADDLGYLISAMGLGAIFGSLLMAVMGDLRNKGLWLVLSCCTWAVLTSFFGVMEKQGNALIVIAMIGLISSWNMSLNRGMLQMEVDGYMRGRIMSIDMMTHGLMPLGVFPIAWIAEKEGAGIALVASGIAFLLLIAIALVVFSSVRRTLRH